jgi:Tfp pilus assembly protein PilO
MNLTGRSWTIIILSLLLIVNGVLFFTYRVRQQERIDELQKHRDEVDAKLIDAQRARMAKEQELAAYRQIDVDVNRIYSETWSTPDVRLVPLLLEVRQLALKSQLSPQSINYAYGNQKKLQGTDTMTITFSVHGRYEQVRRMISMIERSRQFMSIGQINLGSQQGEDLNLNLQLKTLFRADPKEKGARL